MKSLLYFQACISYECKAHATTLYMYAAKTSMSFFILSELILSKYFFVKIEFLFDNGRKFVDYTPIQSDFDFNEVQVRL